MKIAIVTGASSGIGKEFVNQLPHFYRTLDEIWVIARRRDRLEDLKRASSLPLRIFEGDLLEELFYTNFQNTLKIEKPDVRMLINAAGFGRIGTVAEIAKKEPSIQMEMVDLNCRALTKITLICLPYLSRGSRIMNVASAAAFAPQPSFAVYAATKSYVLSFSSGLGAELECRGIRVTAVCPGPVDTEFFTISGKSTNRWKNAVMASPENVVKKALLDSRKGKTVSVYGIPMKAAQIGAKLFPHRLIMKTVTSQERKNHATNNDW